MLHTALKKVAVGIALIGVVGVANAVPILPPTVYNLGLVSTTVAQSNIQISGSFDDIFSFTVGTSPSILATVVGISRGSLSASYAFAVGPTQPVTWTGWTPVPVTGSPFSFAQTVTLTPGLTYWIDVKGYSPLASYSVTLAPVPEPESYAMLLAGLGLMGAVARRRKSKINTSEHGV